MKKLAIISTHPIQYYAPLFREMAKTIPLKVFYTWQPAKEGSFDPGFGKKVAWDIPLLDGYEYIFVPNTASNVGSHSFKGIINPTLNDEITQWGAEAVLIFGWSYNSHLKAMRYFKGKIPVYFRGDSTLLDEKTGLKTLFRRIFLRWVYSYVDKVFYVGNANKAYFKAHGLKENQLIFAPHAVENERFQENSIIHARAAMEIRKELGIGAHDVVILFAGKFESKKNPLLLLEAFIKLNVSNMHLLFVGNGKLEDELKLQAKDNPNIHFMPFQNQSMMPVIYSVGDVFCLPSQGPGETWGLAVNEAMSCGLSVVASDKCGCAQDLVDATNGRVFKVGDVENLQQALLTCVEQETLNSLKSASLAKIKRYSIAVCAKNISEHLN